MKHLSARGLSFSILVLGGLLAPRLAEATGTSISGSLDEFIGPPNTGTNIKQFSKNGVGELSDSISHFSDGFGDNPLHFSGFAYAATDGAGAHTTANVQANRNDPLSSTNTGFITLTSTSGATLSFDDVVVSGPSGGLLRTALSFALSGTQTAGAGQYASSMPHEVSATSGVTVTASVEGTRVLNAYHELSEEGGQDLTSTGYGGLENFTGQSTLKTDLFSVTLGQAFQLTFSLGSRSSVGFNDDGAGNLSASSDFAHTLGFVSGGPVFDLPAGYTVNSVSAHIVNNRFVPVPEPGSFAVLGPGALGLLRRRARRLRS